LDDVFQHPERKELEDLISVASHEMRGPLHALGLLFHLMDRTAASGRALDPSMLVRGNRLLLRLTRLLDELLETSRIWEDRLTLLPEEFDVLDLIHEAVREVDPARIADVRLELPAGPMVLLADRLRTRLMIAHLLDNATRHPPPGSPVVVSAACDETEFYLQIRDEGPGLSPEAIRELLQRQKPRPDRGWGLGIGLFLVHTLVRYHRGTFCLEPGDTGTGLVAKVTLPRRHQG
jgi:signal transduction histidine kinase